MEGLNAICGGISAGLIANRCDKANLGGFKNRIILIPFADIDRSATTSPGMMVTSLVLKASKKAYAIEGLPKSNEAKAELTKGAFVNRWKHTVITRLFEDSVAAKQLGQQLVNDTVVVIMERNVAAGNEDMAFEIYGFECGLRISAATIDPNDADTKGAGMYTLESDESSLEPVAPRTYLVGTASATLTAIEAMLNPV